MTARRAASLVLLAAAAAQSPYSADQERDFERTRQELLARDPLRPETALRGRARPRRRHGHALLLGRGDPPGPRAAALEGPRQPPPQGVLPPLDEARRAEACRLGLLTFRTARRWRKGGVVDPKARRRRDRSFG